MGLRNGTLTPGARKLHDFQAVAHFKLSLHVILSPLTDGRSQLKLDHSLSTECAGGFRTAGRNLLLLAAQSQTPDTQAAALQVDEEIHARCEALIASKAQADP